MKKMTILLLIALVTVSAHANDWKLQFPETRDHFVKVQMTWARDNPDWNPTRKALEDKFDKLDKNGDGLLSKEEFDQRAVSQEPVAQIPPASNREKPNIVVILADDLGPGDIAFYHQKRTGNPGVIPTPNMDRLISEGMRFSDAHSASPLCAPSRFGMMTGSYSYRNYRPYGVWSPCADTGVYPKYTTSGQIARNAGYATAFFGKWGMGGGFNEKESGQPATPRTPQENVDYTVRTVGPNQHGFDYSFELPSGVQNAPFAFYENEKWFPLKPDSTFKVIGPEQNMYNVSRKHNELAEFGDSNWDPTLAGPMLAGKAVDYIKKQVTESPNQPFFIYYCSQAVHIPHTPPDELNGVKIAGSTPGVHGDMVRELDVQTGMLIDALKQAGVYDNTLFIFTSDNGGLAPDPAAEELGHDPTDGWRGIKGAITEGGHRVPFIAVWPGVIASGTESDEPINALDIVATIAAVTGQEISRDVVMDSLNLMPLLISESGARGHESLVHYAQWGGTALRQGDWKLQMWGKNMRSQKPVKLFNLKNNPIEDPEKDYLNNPEQKERAERMLETYERLLREPSVTQ